MSMPVVDGTTRERFLEGPYGADLRELPDGPLYLYLSKPEWANAWIDGGTVPLFLASKYLDSERKGVMTPDEVNQERWDGANEDDLVGLIKIEGDCSNIKLTGCSINGRMMPDTRIDKFREDSFIQSFSTELSSSVMARLDKVCWWK